MKVRIDKAEWYLIYHFSYGDTGLGTLSEVSEETAARWAQAFVDFDKAQDEMAEEYKKINAPA